MRSLRIVFALIFTLTLTNITYSQDKIPQAEAEIEVFQHISEYTTAVIKEVHGDATEKTHTFPDGTKATTNPEYTFVPEDGVRGVNSTTTVFHNFQYRPEQYTYSDQGVTFSPGLYGPGYYYRYQWQPTVMTFPQPAVSVTINVYDYGYYYYYYYYGARLIAYDENGNYMGQITSNHWYWGNMTYTAPAGQKIGYIVMQNKYYTNYSWYTQYMWVTYENNQPPVAIAQDITTNTVANCQADVTAAQIDNGSYDPDGDALTYSVSPTGPYALGSTSVTLTVSDGELSSTATATITVNDVTSPVADLTTLPDVSGECDATIASAPTATDNCAGALTGTTSDPLYYDQQGTYTVTWTFDDGNGNTTTQTQNVVVDDLTAPVADIPALADVTGECDATVTSVPTATDNCAGALTGTTSDPLYYDQQGTYTVTWTFDDGNGNTTTQTQTVIVDDVTAPVITAVANPITLWPPNHKYHTVNVSECFTAVSDNCISPSNSDVIIVKVTSDEAEDANGGGDGNTTDDMVIASDCKSVDLRKERQGNGNGRVYTIHMELDDGNGNIGTATYQVHVPKSKKGTAVDDGAVYEVTGNCSGAKNTIAFEDEIIAEATMKSYPNPTSTNATVEFTLSETNQTTVAVYNAMGLKVATLFDGMAESGQVNRIEFDGSNLAKGLYYIRLQSGNSINEINKLILTR